MRNSFKTMLILALGAGMATLSSCTEDEGNDPVPMEPQAVVCNPTTVTENSDGETITTTYEYNADGQLISSTYGDESFTTTTTYAYTDGKLTTATSDDEVSTFIYADGGTFPTRINTSEDGEPAYFTVITRSGGNITKVENSYYDEDDNAVLEDVTNFIYTNGVLTRATSEVYDETTEEFETELDIQDFVFDGKKNPYNANVAFAFENEFNPLVFTAGNIVSANIVTDLDGQELKLPITGSYTYNDNDYPLTATQSVFGFSSSFTYEYNCQ